jgi:hypothetical protein
MLLAVAGSEPYRAFALLDEPLWRVLYLFHHLQEHDARESLRARMARVDAGVMTAFAFNQPASLETEMRRVQDAIAEADYGPSDAVDEMAALRAKGEALAARIEQGGVLTPDGLVS